MDLETRIIVDNGDTIKLVSTILGVSEQQFYDWVYSNYPNKNYSIQWGFGILYYKENKIHRDGGPAVIWPNGYRAWFKNGLIHRDNGPAVIHADGSKSWYKHGELHRDNGPAVIYANGTQQWYKDGRFWK